MILQLKRVKGTKEVYYDISEGKALNLPFLDFNSSRSSEHGTNFGQFM